MYSHGDAVRANNITTDQSRTWSCAIGWTMNFWCVTEWSMTLLCVSVTYDFMAVHDVWQCGT